MCGFTIFVSKKNKFSKKIFDKKILNHRGPDFFKSIKFKNMIFNHWRLSVVDHSNNSNQPIENKNYIFVYNGEIYDYSVLSKKMRLNNQENSDTRFLFNLLNKRRNLNEIKNFSGFYSYAYLEKKSNKLHFSRDFLGKKPLYYYMDDEKFILSSEEKGIFNFIKKQVNDNSIFEYFFFKNIFYEKTFFKNIKSIPPGSKFHLNINKWNLKFNKNWEKFYKEDLFKNNRKDLNNKIFKQTLIDSIQKRNYCDVKTQLALSSGYDSSLILNIIKKDLKINNFERSISIGFNKYNNESIKAAKIAKIVNSKIFPIKFQQPKLKNLEEIIEYYDAPLEHPSSLGLDLICKETKKIDKVLITGEGADDLFFGYDHYKKKKKNSFAFRPFLKKDVLKKILKDKKNLDIYKQINFKNKISTLRKKALQSKFFSRELEIKTHMQSLLKRNDRISMKNSIEIRCPFLDNEIINIIPKKKLLIKQSFFKQFINKDIFKIINNQKKIGFYVPLNNIYRSNKKRFDNFINIALNYFQSNNLNINKKLVKNNEIKWVLLNIGIFLEKNN